MKTVKTLLVTVLLGGLAGLAVLYLGLYPMGADVPHNRLTYWALETMRERSIARAIRDIEVPPLDDAGLLLAGGEDYNDMCTGCHLKPGKTESELTLGLYPQPPNLAMSAAAHHHVEAGKGSGHGDTKASAARQFWIIKHGIKASGMAAFGATHDDGRIWAMVAFLQKLPELTPAQYQILTARNSVEPAEDASPAEPLAAGAPEASGHESHRH
ncbi:c-type cytochrome [Nevskia sp.]|jgi:mono/diheme cytochrome c family protein|uniref:c-type cytochrome n=1 Tax=Nevskia sp. TaxID=1929292 RepID=UPI003F6E67B7|nr:cytochrome c [Gallionella sp.]